MDEENWQVWQVQDKFDWKHLDSREFQDFCTGSHMLLAFSDEEAWHRHLEHALNSNRIAIETETYLIHTDDPENASILVGKQPDTGGSTVAALIVEAGYSSDSWFDEGQYRIYRGLLNAFVKAVEQGKLKDYACIVYPYVEIATARWLSKGREKVHENIYWPPELRSKTYILIDQNEAKAVMGGSALNAAHPFQAIGNFLHQIWETLWLFASRIKKWFVNRKEPGAGPR